MLTQCHRDPTACARRPTKTPRRRCPRKMQHLGKRSGPTGPSAASLEAPFGPGGEAHRPDAMPSSRQSIRRGRSGPVGTQHLTRALRPHLAKRRCRREVRKNMAVKPPDDAASGPSGWPLPGPAAIRVSFALSTGRTSQQFLPCSTAKTSTLLWAIATRRSCATLARAARPSRTPSRRFAASGNVVTQGPDPGTRARAATRAWSQ